VTDLLGLGTGILPSLPRHDAIATIHAARQRAILQALAVERETQAMEAELAARLQAVRGLPPATSLVGRLPEMAPLPPQTARYVSSSDSSTRESDGDEDRFRSFQKGLWAERFAELLDFRRKYGHCRVPHALHENPQLARWVKRQRYQYKLMKQGQTSTMTVERAQALQEIGFVWDSQTAVWSERLDELIEFRRVFKHCNVPTNYTANKQLARWVKCQRRQYKLMKEGKHNNMTPWRVQELERVGFNWMMRGSVDYKSDDSV